MKTLSYMTGVFLASSLICGAAFADYDDEEFVSTFGFESQQKFTPEEEQYRQIRKQANGRAVSSNLMEKNVMGNESKQKLHADRARLYVIEEMLNDPNITKEKRAELLKLKKQVLAQEKLDVKSRKKFEDDLKRNSQKRYENSKRDAEREIELLKKQAEENPPKSFDFGQIKNHATVQAEHLALKQKAQKDADTVKTGKLDRNYYSAINEVISPYEEEEEEFSGEFLYAEPGVQTYELQNNRDTNLYSDTQHSSGGASASQNFSSGSSGPVVANSINEAQQMFSGQNGLLIPNSPIRLPPDEKEKLRLMVQSYLKNNNMLKIKSYERDTLNALLFNYGIQVLETGDVISLEIVDYTADNNMITPDIPVPGTAQQVYIVDQDLLNMAAQEEMVGVPKQELENANIQMERLK